MSAPLTATVMAPGRWQLDPTRSAVVFTARELGLISVSGSFPVLDGWVDVDSSSTPVSAGGTIDAAGVDTRNPRRDRDLRSVRFLDVEAWPLIRFATTGIVRAGDGWTATGTLEVKGRRVPLSWRVTPGELIEASTELDREAAGIRVPAALIQRRVQVRLDAVFAPRSP